MEKGDQETRLDNDWLKQPSDVLANPTSLHLLDNSSSNCNVTNPSNGPVKLLYIQHF